MHRAAGERLPASSNGNTGRNGIAAPDVLVYVEGGGAFDDERGAAVMPHSVCFCAESLGLSRGSVYLVRAPSRPAPSHDRWIRAPVSC